MAVLRTHTAPTSGCSDPFSAKDFFQDCPWLNIPLQRQGEILIEPLHPRGGLRGGNPSDAAPKVSKLAALAATRKRKENEKGGFDSSKSISTSVSLLDKLNISGTSSEKQKPVAEGPDDYFRKKQKTEAIDSSTTRSSKLKETRKYPKKIPRSTTPPPPPAAKASEEPASPEEPPEELPPVFAAPSAFARALFGSGLGSSMSTRSLAAPIATRFSLPYATWEPFTESNPFAGPSPDDIVANAQAASKGLTKQAKKGKPSGY